MFVITGGGSGIGKALALALARKNHKVLIIGRRQDALEETASHSPLIQLLQADVSTQTGRQCIAEHLKNVKQIKALVNNAGTIQPILPIDQIPVEAWHVTMATNLDAPLFLTQILLNQLKQGRVLNIGSGAAYFPVMGWAAYCVSKAALSMLTRSWQLEHSDTAFASVMPGIIDTDMQTLIRQADHMDPEKLDFFKQLKSEGRLISEATVAEFLTWLLLDLPSQEFGSGEWDIYEESHHAFWLKPPFTVPGLEG